MNTERALREVVMTTPAGRRWRERYLRQLEARRLKEARIARRSRAAEPVPVRATLVRDADAAAAHDVKTEPFAADVRRKRRLLGKRKLLGVLGPACATCGDTSHAEADCSAVAGRRAQRAAEAFDAIYAGVASVSLDEYLREAARAGRAWRLAEAGADGVGMDADHGEHRGADERDEETGREREGGLPKDDPGVNYRYAPDPERSCGECAHFREPAACELVAGMILKTDTCDLFQATGAGGELNDAEEADESSAVGDDDRDDEGDE